MIAPWAEQFIGIPFRTHGRDMDGVDCYGLVALVYARVFRVILNEWTGLYEDVDSTPELQAAVEAGRTLDGWQMRGPAQYRDGDVAVLQIKGHLCHCGIIVDAAHAFMLHADYQAGVVIEALRTPKWANRHAYSVFHPLVFENARCAPRDSVGFSGMARNMAARAKPWQRPELAGK